MATIKIPTPLRTYTDEQAKVDVEGNTIQEVLENLVEKHPEIEQHLFNDGKLRNFVNIFIGEEDIRFMDGPQTEVEADTEVRIIPSIAGGR